jgi:hypothetical protein
MCSGPLIARGGILSRNSSNASAKVAGQKSVTKATNDTAAPTSERRLDYLAAPMRIP